MPKDKGKSGKDRIGEVRPRLIEQEMQESYLDYAMSVIVARALPDVRDGLKPVHRRILYAMGELGLNSKAKFRKSATVVGDVLGKYHPHGDVAVYDSLARMAQNFAMRYPLIFGQGNFGSVDGDEPAAMRYTECKLSKIADEMLSDIDKATVEWVDNYDATRQEPQVLPARLPNLLVNGTMGIAVGMATNIPPHNLGEVVDATLTLIDNPDCSVDDLLKFIQGPDFPTGGLIYNINEIKNAYVSGKGGIVMRAKTEIERAKKGQYRIIVSHIPYQVNKSSLITQIAKLVKDKKIQGIADLRDESDKDGIRIVIELKKDSYPKKILNQLFKFTQMQETFHVNMLALVGGIQPRVLTLKNILSYYIKHRTEVITRRTEFDLKKAKERAHVLEGLRIALSQIDAVIKVIKESASKEAAAKNLISKFQLSPEQASAILDMRLSTLSGLEREKIEQEYKEIKELIARLEKILSEKEGVKNVIKKELKALKEKYADPRKTEVVKSGISKFEQEDLIPNEQVIVTLTKGNYIKRLPIGTYKAQLRGGKGVLGITTKEEDIVDCILQANTHDDILYFTNTGRVFATKVYDVVSTSRLARGQSVANLIQIGENERVTNLINLSSPRKWRFLLMATKKGLVKKTRISPYEKVRKSGLIAIRLRSGDELCWVRPTSGEDQVILVTKLGMSIKFNEKNARPMGRSTSGVRGIKLRSGDEVVGMTLVSPQKELAKLEEITPKEFDLEKKGFGADLMIITENGCGKRTPLKNYPLQGRGGIGIRTARISPRTGNITKVEVVDHATANLVIISKKGKVIRMPVTSAKRLGRATSGVRLIKLESGDAFAAATVFEKIEEAEPKPRASSVKTKSKKFKKTPLSPTAKKKIVRKKAKSPRKGKSKPIFRKKIISNKSQPKFSRREIK